jgi:hypothetical protein
MLHIESGKPIFPRDQAGYWMCGEFTGTAYVGNTQDAGEVFVGAGNGHEYRIQGRVTMTPVDGTLGGANGYTITPSRKF